MTMRGTYSFGSVLRSSVNMKSATRASPSNAFFHSCSIIASCFEAVDRLPFRMTVTGSSNKAAIFAPIDSDFIGRPLGFPLRPFLNCVSTGGFLYPTSYRLPFFSCGIAVLCRR